MTRELTIPVGYAETREALMKGCPAPRRSQIDDTLFRRPDGALARLRRQDTVVRLSCTRQDLELPNPPETIVLDGEACRRALEILGFAPVDRVRLTRETWRSFQYFLHLDRVEGLGDFLTLQAERGSYPPKTYRKIALKFLKNLGIRPAEAGVDTAGPLPYTASITRAASAPS